MSLYEQLQQEHADHDPHGLKEKGQNPAKLHHFPEPDNPQGQEFPRLVYRKNETHTVGSQEELDAAQQAGFTLDYVPFAEDQKLRDSIRSRQAQIEALVESIKKDMPNVSDEDEPEPFVWDGSGTGRYPEASDWTQATGEGLGYPGEPIAPTEHPSEVS